MNRRRSVDRCIVLGAAPVLLLCAQSATRAATYTWTGAEGSDWHASANWAPHGVPGASDAAVIGSGLVQVSRDAVVGSLSLGDRAELRNTGRLTVSKAASSKGLVAGAGSVNIPAGASASFSISGATVEAALERRKTQRFQGGQATTISFQPIRNRGSLRASVARGARLKFGSIDNARGATTAIAASGQVSFGRIKNAGAIRLAVSRPAAKSASASGRSSEEAATILLGDVINEAGGSVLLGGAEDGRPDFLANTVENQGQIRLDDATTVVSSGFSNEAGGLLILQGDTSLVPEAGATPKLENLGVVRKLSQEDAEVALEWVNKGVLSVEGGELQLRAPAGTDATQLAGRTTLQGGDLQVLDATSAPGTLDLKGGILSGSGEIGGNVLNDGGAVNVGFSPGLITINGNFTQTTNGTLNMEIGGYNAGWGYDQLVVNGTTTLAGVLNMLKYGTFKPVVGSSFEIIKFWDIIGNFQYKNLVTPVATYSVYMTTRAYFARCSSVPSSTASAEHRPGAGRLSMISPLGSDLLAPSAWRLPAAR